MHSPDTQTLTMLLERAEGTRDEAALALQRAEQQLERVDAQADQLQRYRTEYIERWSAQFQRQAAIEIVHCYRSFMLRLDQALAQQRSLVERQSQAVAACRRTLQDAELRVAGLKKLIDRREQEHQRAASRHEQKQIDESAQRAGWASGPRSAFM
ncbi:MAG TPA: flagellar export protein FliJ [Rubrivivax sp.]